MTDSFDACKACMHQNFAQEVSKCSGWGMDSCIAKRAVDLFKTASTPDQKGCIDKCVTTKTFSTAFRTHMEQFCKTCNKGMTVKEFHELIQKQCGKDQLTPQTAKACMEKLVAHAQGKATICTDSCANGKLKASALDATKYYQGFENKAGGDQNGASNGGSPPVQSSTDGPGGGPLIPNRNSGDQGTSTGNNSGPGGTAPGIVTKSPGGSGGSPNPNGSGTPDGHNKASMDDVAFITAIHSVYNQARRDQWKMFI